MTLDAIAAEPQFLDHLAPVWRALPADQRGTFRVDAPLQDRARALGIDAEPFAAADLRRIPPPRTRKPTGRRCLVASIGDTKIGRRLGYGDFARLEHGAGQTYIGNVTGSYAGGPDNDDASLILVPNDYAAAHWRKSYPETRVEVVGCPKLDRLPAREPGPLTIAVTFHWPAFVAPEAGTAYGDFATALHHLAREFRVIGTAHPKADWPRRMAGRYARAGIEFVPDFEDVCRRADLLVFDNTSAGFEFAATGRPVVLLNARQYRRRVEHGGRFWAWAGVGINIDAAQDPAQNGHRLIAAVHEALRDAPEQRDAREAALSLIYGSPRTGATQRAADALLSWLGVRQAVAA